MNKTICLSILMLYVLITFVSCEELQNKKSYILYSDSTLKVSNELLLCRNSPFTGIVLGFYITKDTMFYETYKDGLLDGKTKKWYLNHQLSQELNYKKGMPDSIHQSWWENGRKRFIIKYSNQQLNGLTEFWYTNGMRQCSYNYTNGKEDGIQTQWSIDGRPHVYYEVKNGVVLNLTGSKNCIYVQ